MGTLENMHIETPKKIISKSSEKVYEFLSNIKNFEQLMPDNISKFEILNKDRFIFALKGMPEIMLQLQEQQPYSKVVLGATNDKFSFTLTANIEATRENESGITFIFSGKSNAIMTMMIKTPITNFIGTLSENLNKI